MSSRPAPRGAGSEKTGVAALSILSNSTLILLKAGAGGLTGSVALLTEALHSATDLIASIVAYFSVRKSDAPPDAEHPYGHARFEDLAALIEGVLILVGSAVIVFEAIGALIAGAEVRRLGIGIGVLAVSIVVNLVVSRRLERTARATGSPALAADAAHLRTDIVTSAGVLVGLVAVEATGLEWLDPVLALLVAALIVRAGLRILLRSSRVLVDEGLPAAELDAVRDAVHGFGPRGVAGHHALRAATSTSTCSSARARRSRRRTRPRTTCRTSSASASTAPTSSSTSSPRARSARTSGGSSPRRAPRPR